MLYYQHVMIIDKLSYNEEVSACKVHLMYQHVMLIDDQHEMLNYQHIMGIIYIRQLRCSISLSFICVCMYMYIYVNAYSSKVAILIHVCVCSWIVVQCHIYMFVSVHGLCITVIYIHACVCSWIVGHYRRLIVVLFLLYQVVCS